jgi:hypothetical protein
MQRKGVKMYLWFNNFQYMRLKIPSFFVLLTLVLLPGLEILGQPGYADTSRLIKQIPVLNNKLFFMFPASAIASPRVADIMAADPNENKETRIIADDGKKRLVFFVQELFSVAGKTMFDDLSKQVEPDFDFQRKILTDSAALLTVLSTPTLFDSANNGILVNSLTVKSPDNTVCRIDAYINPDAWSQKDEYVKLTEKVFKTISAGTRTINLAAREESYKIPGTNSQFVFKLPANYFITLDEKYDFSVFKINKYKSLTDNNYTSITIYTGHHPTYFHKEYDLTDSSAIKQKGQFLQTTYDWLYFKQDKNNFYLQEQIIPADQLEKGLVFHVAHLTNKKDIMEELTSITEKIKLVK